MASNTFLYYQSDPNINIHRGAIYEFRPVAWLNPPLWIAKVNSFGNPGSADIYNWSNHPQRFFHSYANQHQEDVLAEAKVRPVIILSNQRELQLRGIKHILVAPLYTLRPDNPQYSNIRDDVKPDTFYLPPHEDDSEQRERFADFLQIHRLHRGFLESENKLTYCLSPFVVEAFLMKYKKYLSL